MDVLSVALAVATLGGFVISVVGAWNKAKGLVACALIGTLVMSLLFGFALWSNSKLKAENRLLTDPQARAVKLIDAWRFEADRKFEFFSKGQAEGVVSAAADLMEDLHECRPHAFAEAQQRMQTARERSQQVYADVSMGSITKGSEEIDIWQEAAAAAYEQVKGVSITPPDCGRR